MLTKLLLGIALFSSVQLSFAMGYHNPEQDHDKDNCPYGVFGTNNAGTAVTIESATGVSLGDMQLDNNGYVSTATNGAVIAREDLIGSVKGVCKSVRFNIRWRCEGDTMIQEHRSDYTRKKPANSLSTDTIVFNSCDDAYFLGD